MKSLLGDIAAMKAVTHQSDLIVHVVGPLSVRTRAGEDVTPRGRKAKALLALLALAPGLTRARPWIQDKLWSTRGQPQGAASLRQTLTEIRKCFGALSTCVHTRGDLISLDPKRVRVVLEPHKDVLSGNGQGDSNDAVLLEDVDVRDAEFEDWLREQRSRFAERKAEAPAASTPAIAAPDKATDLTAPTRLRLVVVSRDQSRASKRERVVGDSFTDIVARSVLELGSVEIVDLRGDAVAVDALQEGAGGRITLAIESDVVETGSDLTSRLVLRSVKERRLLSSAGFQHRGNQFEIYDTSVLRIANQLVEEVFSNYQALAASLDERRIATLLAREGAARLLKLGKDNVLAADRLFAQAFELEPRGIYLAWRAYLRTYLLVEYLPSDRQVVCDEAVDLMYRALELEPNNSYVASFSSHVQSIVRRSHVAAYELAERSVQINPANALGWACLGIAEGYLGKATAGFEHAVHARNLAGSSPFRFQINLLGCIAATMAGDVEKAILLGEASHGLSPEFKPPMRFLSALYLLRDQQENAQDMVDRLRAVEPEFSYEVLRDASYPASSLHRSKLLEKLPRRQL